MHGGVGGRGCKVPSYPDPWFCEGEEQPQAEIPESLKYGTSAGEMRLNFMNHQNQLEG